MKKLVVLAIAIFLGIGAYAQNGFNAGVYGGLPVGDASDTHSFNFGVDLSYLWEVSTDFSAGLTTGYHMGLGKDLPSELMSQNRFLAEDSKFTNYSVILVALVAVYTITTFSIGADIGYGIATGDGYNGGFHFRPAVSYSVSDNMQVQLSYLSVNESDLNVNWSTINLGLEFGLD